MRLETLVDRGHRRWVYLYDFGDRWEHDATIETTGTGKAETRYPTLIDGGEPRRRSTWVASTATRGSSRRSRTR